MVFSAHSQMHGSAAVCEARAFDFVFFPRDGGRGKGRGKGKRKRKREGRRGKAVAVDGSKLS